jgi:hypothetical protein
VAYRDFAPSTEAYADFAPSSQVYGAFALPGANRGITAQSLNLRR